MILKGITTYEGILNYYIIKDESKKLSKKKI